ncbi:MAG: hypothetical protein ACI8ZM_005536 [Crocinitomix sp.]|jgi:hypothetical protein
MKRFITKVLGVLLSISPLISIAQEFEPGESYLDENGYVEFLPGNIPIIISVPHGGYLEPDSIPDRACDGCVYVRDSYTQELSFGLREAIYDKTGCYPYVIINLLHRKKFDANRSIETAADGNPLVEDSWQAYHDFIDTAKATIVADYGRGLFIDMHGHAHDIERIELGYLFTKSELQMTDEELNTEDLIDETAIKQLVADNNGTLSCAELIRGGQSLGQLLQAQGFPSIPSIAMPYPLDAEPYFNGGHNTVLHGSKNGGLIDAIQLEFNADVRWNADLRLQLADSLAVSLIRYIDWHYFPGFGTHFCLLPELGVDNDVIDEIGVYPNPVQNSLMLATVLNSGSITIYNLAGVVVLAHDWKGNPIDFSSIAPGVYHLQFRSPTGTFSYCKIIKQ